ncbi:MAG: aminotransferase class IV [Saprospiraceae bacterium]|nr:aminotransferase class IV [Saprospiraceae bacterium]
MLATPADKVLLGVTRKKILELAAPLVKTEERDITFEELLTAKEVYLTSTTKGIMPVVKVDDHAVGNGRPGELAPVLQQKFVAFTQAYLEQKK